MFLGDSAQDGSIERHLAARREADAREGRKEDDQAGGGCGQQAPVDPLPASEMSGQPRSFRRRRFKRCASIGRQRGIELFDGLEAPLRILLEAFADRFIDPDRKVGFIARGAAGVSATCLATIAIGVSPENAGLPQNISYMTRPSE